MAKVVTDETLATMLSRARQPYQAQADLIATLLETVWWAKSQLEKQGERMASMEESLERQAARIANLEARDSVPVADAAKKRSQPSSPQSKGVNLLDLDTFEPPARKEWADVHDDDEDDEEELQGPSQALEEPSVREMECDPWLEAAEKRSSSFLDKPGPAIPAPRAGAAKKAAAPKPAGPSRPASLEQSSGSSEMPPPAPVSRPKARSKPEPSQELVAKLMQAVHAKKLMESPEGAAHPGNGAAASNGSSPPVQKKAAPEGLLGSSKVATKQTPATKPKPKPAPPMLKEKLEQNGS